MPDSYAVCPSEKLLDGARKVRPRLVAQTIYHMRHDGVLPTLRAVGHMLVQPLSRSSAPLIRKPGAKEEVLGLRPGEMVEVKSKEEIRSTLDSTGRLRGLVFLPEMRPFCGQRFRVHKRLERMYLEESHQIRHVTNTVLLAEVFCDGKAVGCDRSCFLYWREAWLRRIPEPNPTHQDIQA